MNIQKFTQKSVEAINNCEKLAYDYGNQEIEQEHLLVALLQQEEGLIPKLIEKMEIDVQHFTQNAISKLDARVKVSGSNSNVYVGKDLNNVLIHAEDEAKAMGDEYFPCNAQISKSGDESTDERIWADKGTVFAGIVYRPRQSACHFR